MKNTQKQKQGAKQGGTEPTCRDGNVNPFSKAYGKMYAALVGKDVTYHQAVALGVQVTHKTKEQVEFDLAVLRNRKQTNNAGRAYCKVFKARQDMAKGSKGKRVLRDNDRVQIVFEAAECDPSLKRKVEKAPKAKSTAKQGPKAKAKAKKTPAKKQGPKVEAPAATVDAPVDAPADAPATVPATAPVE